MSNLDLQALIPEKFRASEILVDLLETISEKLVDQALTEITIAGYLDADLDIEDIQIVLREDHDLPSTGTTTLLIWSGGTPSGVSYEIVTAEYSGTANTYTIERGKHGTGIYDHLSGAYVSRYLPFSLEELFDKILTMQELIDPITVPGEYLQNLADLLGTSLQSADYATEDQRRNELLATIDWYKIKGSYKSIETIGLIVGLTFKLFDMYTNDYETFEYTDWFVGDEGENPTGLDTTYYKSPHFGMFVHLNKVYIGGEYYEGTLADHLWRPSLWGIPNVPDSSVANYVEKTRPANTVPHYGLYLEAPCDLSKVPFVVYDTDGRVVTASVITDNWGFEELYFDEQEESPENLFDDGHNFDTGVEAFISSINTWKIGTDGKLLVWPETSVTIDTVRGEGTVSKYTIAVDRFEFYLTIPQALVPTGDDSGITELGLYSGSNLVLLATFPAIYKNTDHEVYVKIIVYRTKDPNLYDSVDDTNEVPENYPDNITISVFCTDLCTDVVIPTS